MRLDALIGIAQSVGNMFLIMQVPFIVQICFINTHLTYTTTFDLYIVQIFQIFSFSSFCTIVLGYRIVPYTFFPIFEMVSKTILCKVIPLIDSYFVVLHCFDSVDFYSCTIGITNSKISLSTGIALFGSQFVILKFFDNIFVSPIPNS